jgi:uncharacterized protein
MPKKPQPFQLLVKPTSFDCNLRCGYCFYLKTKALYPETPRHLMSGETAERMVRNYLGLGLPVSVLIWQGGEPTLCGLEFFERVVENEKKFSRPGQIIGNAFQTNGLLIDDSWAEFLGRNSFLVGLSMDGPETTHDFFRKDLAGKSTFNRVWNAMQTLRRHNVEFNVLSMVTRQNATQAKEIYRFFREADFKYLQFIPSFDIDPETGAMSEFSPLPEQYREFLAELFELWWPDREKVSIRDFEWLLAPNYEGRMCIFSEHCAPYLAIEHNGDVYPCDFFVREKFRLGNIAKDAGGLPGLFAERERIFSPRKKWVSRSCRSCPWMRFCFGGCLRERESEDNPDPKKSIYCPAYSALFERAWDKIKAR